MCKLKKFTQMTAGILGSVFLLAALVLLPTVAAAQTKGINVTYHTQEEILARMHADNVDIAKGLSYSIEPSFNAPYDAGHLSDGTLTEALKTLNQIRYIAGIPDNVVLNGKYSAMAQAAALVNCLNGKLDHQPARPYGMGDALYNYAYEGASSSNLGAESRSNSKGIPSLNNRLVHGWMSDKDDKNIVRLGHRRWALNPSMGAAGFGGVAKIEGKSVHAYFAMYAFDGAFGQTGYVVAWPAQNMPVKYFGDNYPWSISRDWGFGNVGVTLTRLADNRIWQFSFAGSHGYFNVNNDNYGQPGCVIFRPDGVKYKAGDSFRVSVTENGSETIAYTVNFF